MLVTGILICNRAGTARSLTASILVLTLLVSIRGFFMLGPWLEISILALRWGKSPGNVTGGSSNITTFKQTWSK